MKRLVLLAALLTGVFSPLEAGSARLDIGRMVQAGTLMNWVDGLSKTVSDLLGGEDRPSRSYHFPKVKPTTDPPVTVKIKWPSAGGKLVFAPNAEGELLFITFAEVSPPEYADQVEWELEDIGDSKATYDPARGASVSVSVKGLPAKNDDFGEKMLTAKVGGSQDQVTIKIFFPPKATNHPGKGSGETPNWFYYWQQIKAILGARATSRLHYQSHIDAAGTAGATATGQYSFFSDKVNLSDLIMEPMGCNERHDSATKAPTGVTATGIDCFAEDLWHEYTHRAEYQTWWGSYTNLVLARMGAGEATERDDDRDGVPSWLEENTPGCSDKSAFSCDRRAFDIAPDSEMNSYWEGWKWNIGNADEEDWSDGGKQWE